MSILFANPLLLFGLAAGVIPIIIHRLTHQKTQKLPFPAVRLLMRSQKVVARPQRLKHLLLLALRVTAITLLVLMAARPTLVRPGLLAFGTDGAKAIIIDNSMSMGYEDAGLSRLAQALKAADTINGRLSDRVAIIPTVAHRDGSVEGERFILKSPKEAAKELHSLTLTSGRGNPGAALAVAYASLRKAKGRKEIVFISDMARSDWQGLDPAQLGVVPADGRITFLRIGGEARDSNTAVKTVKTGSSRVVAGSPFPLEVTVSNLSDKDGQIAPQILFEDVLVDQKPLRLKAGEEGTAVFDLTISRSGWLNGEVRLSGDKLAADNVFHLPLFVREKPRIAVVDGDPRGTMRESESYYLCRALSPDDAGGSPFQIQVLHERDFWEKDLSAFDALFLLNVRQPAPAKIGSLLSMGKSVFIFLGDRVLVDEYNGIPLFPWKLREPVEKEERISGIDYGHEALSQFRETGGAGLSKALFRRYYRVEGNTGALLTLGNRDPLLLQSRSGRGRLFLYASSADLDWNDLPLSAVYVPVLQSLVKTALGAAYSPLPPGIRVGETFEEKSPAEQLTGQGNETGIYRFSLSTGETRRAINVPFEESDLTKINEQDLGRLFPGIGVTITEYGQNGRDTLYGGRRDLWPYLLGFALMILAVEMGVAYKS